MLMSHPPAYHPHAVLPKSNDAPRPPPNMGVNAPAPGDREVNHSNTPDYRLYPGPMHASQYHQQKALVPTFQNVIAQWLKSGRMGR